MTGSASHLDIPVLRLSVFLFLMKNITNIFSEFIDSSLVLHQPSTILKLPCVSSAIVLRYFTLDHNCQVIRINLNCVSHGIQFWKQAINDDHTKQYFSMWAAFTTLASTFSPWYIKWMFLYFSIFTLHLVTVLSTSWLSDASCVTANVVESNVPCISINTVGAHCFSCMLEICLCYKRV